MNTRKEDTTSEAFRDSFLEAVSDLMLELGHVMDLAEDEDVASAIEELEGQAGRIQAIIQGKF